MKKFAEYFISIYKIQWLLLLYPDGQLLHPLKKAMDWPAKTKFWGEAQTGKEVQSIVGFGSVHSLVQFS